MANMDKPYEERDVPETAEQLLGVLQITNPLSYDVKFNGTATYWIALALEQLPFFEWHEPEKDNEGELVYPDPKEMKEHEIPDYNIIEDPKDAPLQLSFVRNDVDTGVTEFMQLRQLHHKGVYHYMHPDLVRDSKHSYVNHRVPDKALENDEQQLLLFAMHRDPYFRRHNLRKIYSNSRRDKVPFVLHKNAHHILALGITFKSIVIGIFTGAHEVSAVVQQVTPILQDCFNRVIGDPEPDMFLNNRKDTISIWPESTTAYCIISSLPQMMITLISQDMKTTPL